MGSSSSLPITSSPQQMGSMTATIPEMISMLRYAFRKADFERVEANLLAKEEALKEEVKAKEREMRMIQRKYQILKGDLENKEKEMELLDEKYKVEKLEILKRDSQILELKESNARLLEERSQYEKTVSLLERTNCDLEGAKSRAEKEVEMYRGKFQGLEERTMILEKDCLLKSEEEVERYRGKVRELEEQNLMLEKNLSSKEPRGLKITRVPIDLSGEKGARESGKKCEKIDNEKAEACLSETAENTNLELNEQDANAKTGAAGCKRPLPEDIVDIIDSDDDHAPPNIGSVKKHKGPFQLNEPVSSISSTTSGSSDSDDDMDSFLGTPFLPLTFLRGKQVKPVKGSGRS